MLRQGRHRIVATVLDRIMALVPCRRGHRIPKHVVEGSRKQELVESVEARGGAWMGCVVGIGQVVLANSLLCDPVRDVDGPRDRGEMGRCVIQREAASVSNLRATVVMTRMVGNNTTRTWKGP